MELPSDRELLGRNMKEILFLQTQQVPNIRMDYYQRSDRYASCLLLMSLLLMRLGDGREKTHERSFQIQHLWALGIISSFISWLKAQRKDYWSLIHARSIRMLRLVQRPGVMAEESVGMTFPDLFSSSLKPQILYLFFQRLSWSCLLTAGWISIRWMDSWFSWPFMSLLVSSLLLWSERPKK